MQTHANRKIILKTPELDFFTISNMTKIQNTLFVRSVLIDFMYALTSLHTLISRKLKKKYFIQFNICYIKYVQFHDHNYFDKK